MKFTRAKIHLVDDELIQEMNNLLKNLPKL